MRFQMAKPLGMIKDVNPIHNAIDVYALVLNNIVVNTIVASYNDILAISATYDYCVDVTMNGDPAASTGHTYNASNDTFIAPPPPSIDWPQNVQYDFDGVIAVIQQTLNDCGISGGSLSSQQITAAYNSALNDNPGLDQSTLNLIQSVYEYVLAGG
jgi:hypothetical protein